MTDEGRAALHREALDIQAAQEALADAYEQPRDEAQMNDEVEEPATQGEALDAEVEALLHQRQIEALLFASPDALSEADIAARLSGNADVAGALAALKERYQGRGVELAQSGGKWRFQTAVDVASVLELHKVEPRRLSRAALETLAIIAYHQPCTRAEIEDVRGVAVSKGSLDQLLEIGWVRLKGRRRDVPGRPVLYATTPAFLEHFQLETVSDLPGLADLRAAGLLDARLPPGFSVPTPTDSDEAEGDGEETGESAEFSQDFLSDSASE